MAAKPGSTKRLESALAARRVGRRNAADPRSDQRWGEILTGAATVFRRMGYANATLEDIAEEVGLNRASLYYYVATKADLLVEMLHQPIFDMTKNLAHIRASEGTPTEQLRLAITSHMDALDSSYPELFIFLAEHLHLLTIGDPAGDVVQNARRYGNLFTNIIEEGQRTGEFDHAIHPRIAMMGIVGMCNWTHRWYREDGDMTLAEIGNDFAALAVSGIVVSKQSSSSAKVRHA